MLTSCVLNEIDFNHIDVSKGEKVHSQRIFIAKGPMPFEHGTFVILLRPAG